MQGKSKAVKFKSTFMMQSCRARTGEEPVSKMF